MTAGTMVVWVLKAGWAGVRSWWQRVSGQAIQITEPASQGTLGDAKPLGKSASYRVRGKLKRLPEGHRIWLLIEDERNGNVWPQGFEPVAYNAATGIWEGRVNPGSARVLIHAVVAPPTTVDFFLFFQDVGSCLDRWRPIRRVPIECLNRAFVHAVRP